MHALRPDRIASTPRTGSVRLAALAIALSACSGGSGGPSAGPPPELVVSVTSVSFQAVAGGPNPDARALQISNGGGGTLAAPTTAIAYASGTGWLSVSTSGTSAPFTISFAADVSALVPGTYSATVSIHSAGARSSPRDVSVSLSVEDSQAGPTIALSATSLVFSAVEGGSVPPDQLVIVSNSGSGTLSPPTVTVAYAGGGPTWLSAPASGAAAPYTITLQAGISSLGAGTHAATLTIDCPGATNTPVTVEVTVTVSATTPAPTVLLSARALSFSGASYGSRSTSQDVTVTNGGGGELAPPSVSISYQGAADWLVHEVGGTSAPYTITLQPVPERLAAGTYTATVEVRSAGASNAPQSVSVTLTLTPSWTVFVYGHADNDRSIQLLGAIQEMSEAVLGDAVRLVVAADYSAGRRLPTGDFFPSGTEWYRVLGSGLGAERFAFSEEQNFDDPAVLSDAVAAVFSAFPADHLAVVLWGRGAAWEGGFGRDENDTPDDASDDGPGLTPDALADALSNALSRIGVAQPLDFVAFDASLMMGQEIAYALRNVANVLVANAEVELGAGWDYATSLGRLGANPATSGLAFAAAEVLDWDRHHASAADVVARAHAALDLTDMEPLASAHRALSTAVVQSATLDWLELARVVSTTSPAYAAATGTAAVPAASLRDAGSLLTRLGTIASDTDVAGAALAARAALEAVSIASSLGDVRAAAGQSGVHVEATVGATWLPRAAGYSTLAWEAASAWGDILGALAGNDDGIPPSVETVAVDTGAPDTQNPPRILFSSPDGDVSSARLHVVELAGGHVVWHGTLAEMLIAPGEEGEVVWDRNLFALSDGATTSHVFLQPWIGGGAAAAFLLPGVITDGVGTVDGYAILVDGNPVVDAVALGKDGALTALPLGDFGGLQFIPRLWDETDVAWKPQTPLTIPSGDGASLSFERLSAAPGAYRIVTTIADVWGNVGEARDDVTVLSPFGN